MVRALPSALPVVAVWALALARLSDGCPSADDDPEPISTCRQRTECRDKEGQFLLSLSATVTRSCQWIVDSQEDYYIRTTKQFNLTAQGGCTTALQIAPATALAEGNMEAACTQSRLKSKSLFIPASRLVVLPTQYLLDLPQQQKRTFLGFLIFKSGKAMDLCRQPVLVVNESSYVKTPYITVSLPCSTMLVAESGKSLNVTVIDAWPSQAADADAPVVTTAAPGCVCYQIAGHQRNSTCWYSAGEPAVHGRIINITVGAAVPVAASDSLVVNNELACTIVLRVDVVDLRMDEETTTAEANDELPAPESSAGSFVQLFVIVISATVGGGIVLIGGLAVIGLLCHRRRSSRNAEPWLVKQPRRLPPTPSGSAAQADEPVYHELDNFTYAGHLTRVNHITGIKEGSPDAGNGSTTNDYEEIRPLNNS